MKPTMLTVSSSQQVRVGDMMRMSTTGDVYYVSGASVWREDVVDRVSLWRGLWRLVTGRPAFTEVVDRRDVQHTLRVWRWRPSPLPHRLP